MYDLNKIVILSNYGLEDEDGLETVVMKTDGLKVTDILYVGNRNSKDDSVEIDIKSELYNDMYDDETLNIKISEAYNGEDALNQVATFIDDIWDKDSLVYYYNNDYNECLDYLIDEIKNYNGKIYIDSYMNIFNEPIEKPIEQLMEEQGLKISNMIKDSSVSFIYFLHALVEKMINR